MSQIILDISANTHKNNISYLKRMMDTIKELDAKTNEIIFKAQLFKNIPPNIPITYDGFKFMYDYGNKLGYQVTASVFDTESLNYLLNFEVPFIKIANNKKYNHLISLVPSGMLIYKSIAYTMECLDIFHNNIEFLCCVSDYPAEIKKYINNFIPMNLELGISDHTVGWDLYKRYYPEIYECHYVLEHDDDNPDGGAFARTPEDLEQIL